jgi:hypothetical protein
MIVAFCTDCGEDEQPVLDCYFCGRIRCVACASAVEDIGQVCRECIAEGRGAAKHEP